MTNVDIETVELEPRGALVVRRRVAVSEFGKVLADIHSRVHQHIARAGRVAAHSGYM